MTNPNSPEMPMMPSPFEAMDAESVQRLMDTSRQAIEVASSGISFRRTGYRVHPVHRDVNIEIAPTEEGAYQNMTIHFDQAASADRQRLQLLHTRIKPRSDNLYDRYETKLTVGRDIQSVEMAAQIVERAALHFVAPAGSEKVSLVDATIPRWAGEDAQIFLDNFLNTLSQSPLRRTGFLGRIGLRHVS